MQISVELVLFNVFQCVPKKEEMTEVGDENNELIPTGIMNGQRMCMDYRRLNKATCNNHFPLSFIDQMFDKLARKSHNYVLDSYLGYNKFTINPEDHEKTTFTCLHDIFTFRMMSFELCNTLETF